jgi:hypothetical protein
MKNKKLLAGLGEIYVCSKCGKQSKHLYGDECPGWDVSCMLNAVLCTASSIILGEDGRVTSADAVDPI